MSNEASSVQSPTNDGSTSESLPLAQFSCGNPNIEKIEGIVHFYKENKQTSLAEDVSRPKELCILNVPTRMALRDFLDFIKPSLDTVGGIRIVKRAVSQSFYMVLLGFRSQQDADHFYQVYNRRQYNSLEPESCNVVYVAHVELTKQDSGQQPLSTDELVELPTCTVCLERMDESVEGVVTVLCNHKFHPNCIQQYSDTTCPICRSAQTPDYTHDSTACSTCGATFEDLWICLICGNVGCGRYQGRHAYTHYEESHHLFSMHLSTGRVWDYAGDNYVHRLIQSKGDGKLVEIPAASSNNEVLLSVADEKIDSVTMEYNYLLTSQLESQRKYFEEKMMDLEQMCNEQLSCVSQEFSATKRKLDEVNLKIAELKREKEIAEQKYGHANKLLQKIRSDLEEEKAMNQSLRSYQSEWKKRAEDAEAKRKEDSLSKDTSIKELEGQLRDLYFHLESQQKLGESGVLTKDELQNNHLVITGSPGASNAGTSKSRRKKSGTSSNK